MKYHTDNRYRPVFHGDLQPICLYFQTHQSDSTPLRVFVNKAAAFIIMQPAGSADPLPVILQADLTGRRMLHPKFSNTP